MILMCYLVNPRTKPSNCPGDFMPSGRKKTLKPWNQPAIKIPIKTIINVGSMDIRPPWYWFLWSPAHSTPGQDNDAGDDGSDDAGDDYDDKGDLLETDLLDHDDHDDAGHDDDDDCDNMKTSLRLISFGLLLVWPPAMDRRVAGTRLWPNLVEKIRDQKDQLQLKHATLLRRKSGTLQIQKVIKPSLLSTAGAVGAISPRIAKIRKSKMGQGGRVEHYFKPGLTEVGAWHTCKFKRMFRL